MFNFLQFKSMQVTTDELAVVGESIQNILQVSDREYFGRPAFFSVESFLGRNENGFKQVAQDRIKNYISTFERRCTILSVDVTQQPDRITFNIDIAVQLSSGTVGTISFTVIGI